MSQFTNGFGEDRVVPMLGYTLVPAGATITVPDEEDEHWIAGGWTPVPAAAPVAKPKPAASPEGAETA